VGDGGPLVLVDAMMGAPAGRVEPVAIAQLDDTSRFGASSHGLGLGQLLALARVLSPGFETRLWLQVVGVGIAMPTRGVSQLSPAVRAAIPTAAALAVALVRGVVLPG
jgi:Ni,Fe-hydrogenase maturation factor